MGDEVESVLANWIGQALAPEGRLPEGESPASWVAARFLAWWGGRAGEALEDAEGAAAAIEAEFQRLGGWEACGDALHEVIHLREALAELRGLLGADGGAE